MAEADHQLKLVFLPFFSTSHIIPLVDIARIFAIFGVDVTIIATPANAAIFQKSIDRDSARGRPIRTHTVKFPFSEVDLPEGIETFNADTPRDMTYKIHRGLSLLKDQFEQLFQDYQADCIVTDMFFPWSVETAAKMNIPRLIYVGGSRFAHALGHSIEKYEPHTKVESDTDTFVIPGLPDEIRMTLLQVPDSLRTTNEFTYMMKAIKDSERKSFGSLFDSFSVLDGAYLEHYKKVMGTKSWGVGPVSAWANQGEDKAKRGRAKVEEEEGWLKWLNTKTEESVIYVSFGSMNRFPLSHLIEIAHGLESSGHNFLWVVPKKQKGDEGFEFLEEFEKRVKETNRGYVFKGWAPQLLILDHPAIGGVVTHCGWNTVMESVNAGLPMVTWPLFAEQFENEKLLVDVLKIGVAVGCKEWRKWDDFPEEAAVTREEISKAVALLMGDGEEAKERRTKAKELSQEAKKAIEAGGSSYNSVKEIIEEIRSYKRGKVMHEA
ncbi:hypothetical protein QN277_003265 [Acacia crassicarpa]|uniref:Glycosyltransferase n=1 Tax=Acacia crassicarpa TaxID=499986 RepID=A0AAE1MAP1_9FABA|nr:hypothetical protein QN277_003265 [Acacia crassicarpa]